MRLIVIIYSSIISLKYGACLQDNYTTGPTIVALPFNATDDAHAIIEEMKAKHIRGKHKEKIIDILVSRTIAQRLEIGVQYNNIQKEDFHRDIKNYFDDSSHDSDKNVFEIISTTADFLARRIKHSIKKRGEDHGYMSIICTSTAKELIDIRASYLNQYKVEMGIDIPDVLGNSELTRFLSRLFGYNTTLRSDAAADSKKTAELVKAIPEHKSSCNLQDASALYEMMKTESFKQIKAVAEAYKMNSNSKYSDPLKAIDKNCDSDLKEAFIRIMNYSMDPFHYYAHEIERAFHGKGSIDSADTRVMISRSEIDLADIRTCYDNTYEHGLKWAIEVSSR
ncbi:hypothetical protein LSTR_LSTR007330 [Laodelphax striatellus]|uniref:Annexin n=1 Tax=Laodelphax striatellus TaxID=195883 RepID=A0A482WSS9_LAOST|nr:hypothetical protein LSTR_LSTR007330 [Laodelphax striatellus]